jgi:predicted nucleotidyltransferase
MILLFLVDNYISIKRQRDMEKFRRDIEMLLRQHYSDCRIDLFGSAHNGLGFESSDVDLCMRFSTDSLPQVSNYFKCIGTYLLFIGNLCKTSNQKGIKCVA